MRANVKNDNHGTATITEISGKLKRVCKELEIPIIALAQLSRAVESRAGENFMPKLSDLRESGSIEQDADNVVFLWRPEYYELEGAIKFKSYSDMGFPPKDFLAFIIAKCRDGETKKIPAHINLSTMTVKDHPDLEFFNDPAKQSELPLF